MQQSAAAGDGETGGREAESGDDGKHGYVRECTRLEGGEQQEADDDQCG